MDSCSLFESFATEYGFTHVTSSSRYLQANGEAERAVATVKGLWKRGGDKAKALQTYRATPLESDYSPAQLLMGRQIRSDVPQHPTTLRPRWPNIKGFRRSEKQAKEDQQRRYNLRHRVRSLPQLQPGQDVWLTRERKQGTVIQKAVRPASFTLMKDSSGVIAPTCAQYKIHSHRQRQTQMKHLIQAKIQVTQTHPLTLLGNQRATHIQRQITHVTSSGRVSGPPRRLDL